MGYHFFLFEVGILFVSVLVFVDEEILVSFCCFAFF